MNRSLRFRLLLAAAITTLAVLAAAGWGIITLFEQQVERRIEAELDAHLTQLAGTIRILDNDDLAMRRIPADPRFDQVYSGFYYQIVDLNTGRDIRSRSLWDSVLALPEDVLKDGARHVHRISGPDGQTVLVHERRIEVTHHGEPHFLRLAVALDTGSIALTKSEFRADLLPILLGLAAILIAGSALQVAAVLRPLRQLRDQIGGVRAARTRRIDGDVPAEVAPLVSELNQHFEAQEQDLVRARRRASDIAHGLKTPLTALMIEADSLRDAGPLAQADSIAELARQLRRTVDRELARTNLGRPGRTGSVPIRPVIESILRTVSRIPSANPLAFRVAVDPTVTARIDPDDLAEIIGNVVENAARYACSTVSVGLASRDPLVLTVEDDGPGVDTRQMDRILEPGTRLDETGSAGLGLAIVSDVLAVYSGRLELGRSDLGGLRVAMTLPA